MLTPPTVANDAASGHNTLPKPWSSISGTNLNARKADRSRWACCRFGLNPSWGFQGPLLEFSQSPGLSTFEGILKGTDLED